MILSMVSVTAYAAGEKIELSVTADKTVGINAGDVVTVKVSVVDFNGALSSLGFNLFFDNTVFKVGTPTYNFPEGFTLSLVTPLQDKGKVAYSSAGASDATSLSGDLLTVSFTAKTDINAPVEFSLVDNGTMFNTTTPVSPVGKLKEQIYALLSGNLPIDITAPVKDKTPQSAIAATTQYTGIIAWDGNPTTFEADTAYTAKVTLTANTGYQFASGVHPAVAGATEVTGVDVGDGGSKLKFKATFPKTDDKDSLPTSTSVSISGTPQIDKPLTANVTGLPASPGALTYKWYRDGETTPISGANTDTYTPSVAADVGKQIKVEVSAANYSGSVTSAPTAAVEKKDYVGSAAVLPTGGYTDL